MISERAQPQSGPTASLCTFVLPVARGARKWATATCSARNLEQGAEMGSGLAKLRADHVLTSLDSTTRRTATGALVSGFDCALSNGPDVTQHLYLHGQANEHLKSLVMNCDDDKLCELVKPAPQIYILFGSTHKRADRPYAHSRDFLPARRPARASSIDWANIPLHSRT